MKSKLIILLLFAFAFFPVDISSWKWKKAKIKGDDDEEDIDADIFCKNRTGLIRLERSEELYIVDTSLDNTILLKCRYCEDKDDGFPKVWYVQKHIFTGNLTEVNFTTTTNTTNSKLSLSRRHSLLIRNIQEEDLGVYLCVAATVDSVSRSFNYLLDFSDPSVTMKGNITQWNHYSENYLKSVHEELKKFTIKPRGSHLHYNVTIFTDWADWSECQVCGRQSGIRERKGHCRVKPLCEDPKSCFSHKSSENNTDFSENQNTEKPDLQDAKKEVTDKATVGQDLLQWSVGLPCRGLLLKAVFPEVYNTTLLLPDFTLVENCTGVCQGRAARKGPRFKTHMSLSPGGDVTFVCPGASVESEVRWEHNKLRLYPHDAEGDDSSIYERVYVDSFNTLYLSKATESEAGNYTCFVDGVRIKEILVVVHQQPLLLTKEFVRHLEYLGYIFTLCFVAYLSGVTIVCVSKFRGLRNKHYTRRRKSRRDLTEDTEENEEELSLLSMQEINTSDNN